MSQAKEAESRPEPTPDQAAAHELLTELRTRIATQPLPLQFGVEARALESLWEVFARAREAMKNHPGCEAFAREATAMLNLDLRPVTSKWHRAYTEGRLGSRDGANEFRADLAAVRAKLCAFADRLHLMAYGTRRADRDTPAPMDDDAVGALFADLPFGIPARNGLIDDATVEGINAAEALAVRTRREHHGIDAAANAVGLGLSGGGIRSATFCLGVTQVLAERGLLRDVDFLSTVSGGGYLGAFLTTRLDSAAAYGGVAAPHGPDTGPIRHLRRRAKYLLADNLRERWGMVTATLAGMLLNWTAPLFLLCLAAMAAIVTPSAYLPSWGTLFLAGAALTAASLLVYAFRMRFRQRTGSGPLAAAAAFTALAGCLWLLEWTYGRLANQHLLAGWRLRLEDSGLIASGLLAAVATAVPAMLHFLPVLREPAIRKVLLRTALILAGLILPLGAVAAAFLLYGLGNSGPGGFAALAALTVVSGLVALLLLNINLTGPHRLYRDQLARTFIQLRDGDAAAVPLEGINAGGFAPYHLINAAANLPTSADIRLRERRSDFFLFSREWCGAPAIGYAPTARWTAHGTPIDLATAMAVSGAAASSLMGLGSMPALSALLAFLNVRLGYWIRRPGAKARRAVPGFTDAPGFSCLMREMLGVAMSEEQAWINLSDGGHIENMGVYELLRRRCKFIVSVDGEADPRSGFQGHLTLVRHAQIDFGIRMEPDLTQLRPDLTSRFSQSHAMLCRVHYPAAGGEPAGTGLILYLKLSVTGNELELIKRYRALNPDFPHQSTLDQFFDEEQFEAYRQLGVHVAEGLFSPALLAGGRPPSTVRDWFESLAGNLLLPEG